jgi:hypothetical protein
MPLPAPTRRRATELTLVSSAIRRGLRSAARKGAGARRGRCCAAPVEIELDHPLPLLDRGVDDRPEQHHAGVVDHHVEQTELLPGALDGGLRPLTIGDVCFDRQTADFGRERVQPTLARRDNATVAPSAASARAVVSAIPLLAPVTSATVSPSAFPAGVCASVDG